MTYFERWLEERGAKLVSGTRGSFSTYGNVERTWIYGDTKIPIQVGLVRGNDNMIAIRHPIITYLPQTEEAIGEFMMAIHSIPTRIEDVTYIKDNND
jgi:hypothetical protein